MFVFVYPLCLFYKLRFGSLSKRKALELHIQGLSFSVIAK